MGAELLLTVLEIAAVVAFAISAFIEAARKHLDVVGVFAVAFVTAFGGGTLRDLLIDRRPFFWVEHQEYVWLVFALSAAATPCLRRLRLTERAIRVPDALGMGLFSVVGASQALELAVPPFVAALMGVITGVFGGVMRDIICNEIPTVFRDRRPYAVCSFAGSWGFLGLHLAGAHETLALAGGAALAAGLRLVALARGWRVPSWN
ncbi:MAG: trimeric intracellular cation channel family protein [Rhodocyclaceae bacterium]